MLIDIHSHLLPEIDDGARSMKQSLELARLAVQNGITHSVLTPHIQPGRYDNTLASIRRVFCRFVEALQNEHISLHIAMAAEVRICPEILHLIEDDQMPFYISAQGEKSILLELPHSHVPPGSDKMLSWLCQHGIRTILAHPERNKELMKNIDKVKVFIDSGCLLQLTSGSISGRFGAPVQSFAHELLRKNWVDIIASDAHNLLTRPPELKPGRDSAALIVGVDHAQAMVAKKPWFITGGMFNASS